LQLALASGSKSPRMFWDEADASVAGVGGFATVFVMKSTAMKILYRYPHFMATDIRTP